MLPSVLVVLLVSMAVGVALLVLGLRGRRVNDHPICRWCSFDLKGVYPESVTCPECGAGLKRDGAVRLGARRRLAGMIFVGALLAIAPTVPLGVVAFATMTGSDLNAYKPVGLLLWEAKNADAARSGKIADELVRRAMAKSLAADQYTTVIDAALALQGDTSRAWNESWGSLIERAELDGVLSAADRSRFDEQAGVLQARTRARAHAGQTVPLRVTLAEARVAPRSAITWSTRLAGVRINGSLIDVPENEASSKSSSIDRMGLASVFGAPGWGEAGFFGLYGSQLASMGSLGDGELNVEVVLPVDLPPGKHTIELELDVRAASGRGGAMAFVIGAGGMMGPAGAGGDSHRVRVTTEVEVVRPGTPVVEPITPTAELEAQLVKALEIDEVTRNDMLVTRGGRMEAAPHLEVSAAVKKLPVPVAFDVYCRADGREWLLGTIDSSEGEQGSATNRFITSSFTVMINGMTRSGARSSTDARRSVSGSAPGLGQDVRRVEVVLRPNAKAAGETVDLDRFYDGEIVIPDVPVVPGTIMPDMGSSFMRQVVPGRPVQRRGGRPL